MTFTALTGSGSHFMLVGKPDIFILAMSVLFTLIWARIGAKIANKSTPKTLNRTVGVILTILGLVILLFSFFGKQ